MKHKSEIPQKLSIGLDKAQWQYLTIFVIFSFFSILQCINIQ